LPPPSNTSVTVMVKPWSIVPPCPSLARTVTDSVGVASKSIGPATRSSLPTIAKGPGAPWIVKASGSPSMSVADSVPIRVPTAEFSAMVVPASSSPVGASFTALTVSDTVAVLLSSAPSLAR
jgi:hypothetical protein